MSEAKLNMYPGNKWNALDLVSPQQAKVLEMQQENADAFDTSAGTYEEMRAAYRKERERWNSGGPQMAQTIDFEVPFEDHTVKARLLRPVNCENLPVLFFIHGGGFVLGDNDTHGLTQRKLAAYGGVAVIGIEYTLAPEARYPQPVLECAEVVRYVCAHAQEFSIDPGRIGFAGDSGGGNFSMAVTLYLRDTGFDTSAFKANVLFYGMFGLTQSRSHFLYGGLWDGMTEADLKYYSEMYLGEQKQIDCPYFNIFANDLSYGVPPCFIAAAELDPLRDDNLLMYDVLTAKGLPCEYREYKGALHAFIHYSKIMDDAEDALRRGAHFFARACGLESRN